jgi:GntR family transcriptional regulator
MEIEVTKGPKVSFLIDRATGVPAYRQIVNQVLAALRFGTLAVGDQLPTVTAVVRTASINVNTVLKAYKVLETQGITFAKPGVGTLIIRNPYAGQEEAYRVFRDNLDHAIGAAIKAGLSSDDISVVLAGALERFYEKRSIHA